MNEGIYFYSKEEMKGPKMAFEWVLTMSKGDDVILSENQYAAYKANIDHSKIFFMDSEINPAFVVSAIKVPANYIKKKYPCKMCFSSGRKSDNSDWCDNCGGSGVDLPKPGYKPEHKQITDQNEEFEASLI